VDLSYELATLAPAATAWEVSRLEPRDDYKVHIEEMSQVAALVHQRSICEFLNGEEGWNKLDRSPHRPPAMPLWKTYERAVHERVLHPDPRRA
jgi:hypothetical protein